MTQKTEIRNIVDQVINEYKERSVDLLGIGDAEGEYGYLINHKKEFLRTVYDIVAYFHDNSRDRIRILEIGAFLGVVSIVLSKFGFDVTATDIEEYISCPNLQKIFKENNVKYLSCDLRDYHLPFDNEEYDAVIMCETLEHLNFNPLPVIQEINRILKSNGLLYLTLPNIASLRNRKALLSGNSIHNPIKDFFAQLNSNANMIVGLHWREYTTAEIKEMLEMMNFEVSYQNYEGGINFLSRTAQLKKIIKKLIFRLINIPFINRLIYDSLVDPDDASLKNKHINFAQKKTRCDKQFHFRDVTLNKKTR